MSTSTETRASGSATDRFYRRFAAAVLAAIAVSGTARAGALDGEWQLRPELNATGISEVLFHDGVRTTRNVVAGTAELAIRSRARAWHGGTFLDYRYSLDRRFRDSLNAGGFFRYDLPRWDATAWLFANRSPGGSGTWLYAGRLRYRVSDRYKVGVEAMAPLARPASPTIVLGYYGSVADYLTIKVFAGTGVDGGPDLAGRLELSWQLR